MDQGHVGSEYRKPSCLARVKNPSKSQTTYSALAAVILQNVVCLSSAFVQEAELNFKSANFCVLNHKRPYRLWREGLL